MVTYSKILSFLHGYSFISHISSKPTYRDRLEVSSDTCKIPAWPNAYTKPILYKIFSNNNITYPKYINDINKAFQIWESSGALLKFNETFDSSKAEIKISFKSANHTYINGKPCASYLQDHVLAHAVMLGNEKCKSLVRYYEGEVHEDKSKEFIKNQENGYGEIHINSEQNWIFESPNLGDREHHPGSHYFLPTLVHEIGHVLGFQHVRDKTSIMYQYSNDEWIDLVYKDCSHRNVQCKTVRDLKPR